MGRFLTQEEHEKAQKLNDHGVELLIKELIYGALYDYVEGYDKEKWEEARYFLKDSPLFDILGLDLGYLVEHYDDLPIDKKAYPR